MAVFLLIDLTAAATFQSPLVARAKHVLPPEAVILDVDARSGSLLLHYVLPLLRDAKKAAIVVLADESVPDFGNLMPLIEQLLAPPHDQLVILLGQHPRLARMWQARPQLAFKQVATPTEALHELRLYLA